MTRFNIGTYFCENFKNQKLTLMKTFTNPLNTIFKNLSRLKKRDFYQVNIEKPKELWKTLKSLGLPSKKSCESKIC